MPRWKLWQISEASETGRLRIGPAVLFLLLFIVYPTGFSLRISLHDFFLITPRPPSFVGLDNYRTIFDDPVFWKSVRVTVIYTVCAGSSGGP